jgi:hypothetical protein
MRITASGHDAGNKWGVRGAHRERRAHPCPCVAVLWADARPSDSGRLHCAGDRGLRRAASCGASRGTDVGLRTDRIALERARSSRCAPGAQEFLPMMHACVCVPKVSLPDASPPHTCTCKCKCYLLLKSLI